MPKYRNEIQMKKGIWVSEALGQSGGFSKEEVFGFLQGLGYSLR